MADRTWLRADLGVAVEAVRRAAELVASQFRLSLEVRYKDPDQPVTAADLAADELLRDALTGARPGYGWLSEESSARPGSHDRTWMVDPIDGTSSFIAHVPEFAVSVGLVEGDRPVLGVVANPATGDLFTATAGGGAFLNGRPLAVRSVPSGRVLVVSRAEQDRGLFGGFAGWEQVTCGSTAIKLCRVAAGAADAYLSFGPKRPWDLCAAELVVREAGGHCTDLGGEALRYAGGQPPWRGVVAARPGLHEELLRLAAGSLAPESRGR